MDNVTIVKDYFDNEYVIIDNGDGSFTSMTKDHYDELQKQADQPIGGNK